MYKRYITGNTYQRFVTVEDASFIYELRTDPKLSLFLSATTGGIEDQINWITNYKLREEQGLEFYFITEDDDGVKYGVNRIYNIRNNVFESGSWLFKRNTASGISILSDIATREYGYDVLNLAELVFEVRKENKSVLNYHKLFSPSLIGEDELNYYFRLTRENFNSTKNKILKIYGKG